MSKSEPTQRQKSGGPDKNGSPALIVPIDSQKEYPASSPQPPQKRPTQEKKR